MERTPRRARLDILYRQVIGVCYIDARCASSAFSHEKNSTLFPRIYTTVPRRYRFRAIDFSVKSPATGLDAFCLLYMLPFITKKNIFFVTGTRAYWKTHFAATRFALILRKSSLRKTRARARERAYTHIQMRENSLSLISQTSRNRIFPGSIGTLHSGLERDVHGPETIPRSRSDRHAAASRTTDGLRIRAHHFGGVQRTGSRAQTADTSSLGYRECRVGSQCRWVENSFRTPSNIYVVRILRILDPNIFNLCCNKMTM